MGLGNLKNRIENLEKDLKQRISNECETIKEAANPREELNRYIKNIRFHGTGSIFGKRNVSNSQF